MKLWGRVQLRVLRQDLPYGLRRRGAVGDLRRSVVAILASRMGSEGGDFYDPKKTQPLVRNDFAGVSTDSHAALPTIEFPSPYG